MMKARNILSVLLALTLVLGLAACGGSAPDASDPAPAAETALQSADAPDGGDGEAGDSGGTGDAPAYQFTSPIEIIVPQNPGEISDLSARLLGKYLSDSIGQSVVIVNTPGAGGSTAAHKVDDAPADGNTLLYIEEATLTNSLVGTLDMSWRDFDMVCYFGDSNSFLWACSLDSGIDSVEALKQYYEDNGPIPAGVTAGNPSHFYAVAIEQATGIEFKHIDAGSGSDKLIAVLSGQLDSFPSSYSAVADYLTTGEIITAGCLGPVRSPIMPAVPTFNEQGADLGTGFTKFFMLGATKGTPSEVVDALNYHIEKVMSDPEVVAEFAANGYEADYKDAAAAVAYIEEKEAYLTPIAEIINESMA